MEQNNATYWLSVVARTLAHLCLQTPELREQKLARKSEFLRGLGLSYKDAAAILNSTEASLRELERQGRKAKEKRHGGKKR